MVSFIVMARDECNTEFRPSNKYHSNEDDAYAELSRLREVYEEARSMWVEEYREASSYQREEWEW